MPQTSDVVIIGGGVIGCSVAYQLAKLGVKSTVLERAHFAAGASGATAGVVGPLWHLEPESKATFDLGMRTLEMFPSLANELVDAGVDPGFRQKGILKLAFTQDEVEELKDNLAWQGELGHGVSWLEPSEILQREPEVNPHVLGGVFSPEEGHVIGQRYVEALVHAASRLGVTFLQGAEVIGLEFQGGKVIGVHTATETYFGGHTVLAAGPWTGIAGRWLPQEIPVRPVKGQRILLRKVGFLPKCPVRNFDAYVVPWTDGKLLVGATREEGSFDEETTAEAVHQMISSAITSFPALRDASFLSARAGVRPGTPDDIPILGPVPGWEGLSIASGHDHVGVTLSAGTGELMADYISTGDSSPLEPFSLARFQTELSVSHTRAKVPPSRPRGV